MSRMRASWDSTFSTFPSRVKNRVSPGLIPILDRISEGMTMRPLLFSFEVTFLLFVTFSCNVAVCDILIIYVIFLIYVKYCEYDISNSSSLFMSVAAPAFATRPAFREE
jgi:hypothetical protein